LRQLRGGCELKDYPNFEADWSKLESISTQNLRSVRAVVGNGITLTRTEELNTLTQAVASVPMTLVVGESEILVQSRRSAGQQERPTQRVEHSFNGEVMQIAWVTQVEAGERRNYDQEVPFRLCKSQEIGYGRTY
jgi:hypothetical protein